MAAISKAHEASERVLDQRTWVLAWLVSDSLRVEGGVEIGTGV